MRHSTLLVLTSLSILAPSTVAQEKKTTKKQAEQKVASVQSLAKQSRESLVIIHGVNRDGKRRGLGTGFVVDADGLICTNLHVIGEARPFSIELASGKKLPVKGIHAWDRRLDLAVVRVDAKGLKPLKLAPTSALPPGTPIVAMGNPQGLKYSVVSGVLSETRLMEGRKMLQLAIPIEPGNSGGPVLDRQGNVLGIVTMKSLVTNNLGFAITVESLKRLLKGPNTVTLKKWLTIGTMDASEWSTIFGARWRQRAGRILVDQPGKEFGGRSLCLSTQKLPPVPYEMGVSVKLDDERGAAGLAFFSDGKNRHYGFYPSSGNMRFVRFEGSSVYTWKVLHNQPTAHYRPGDWNHLKVRIEKNHRFKFYVNDHLILERTDRTYSSGRFGLAKFRKTKAEFRHFRIGKSLPPSQPSAKQKQSIAKSIAALGDFASITPKKLAKLVPQSAASGRTLRSKAAELEKRAAELRRLANDVHIQSVTSRLKKVIAKKGDFDLMLAAMLIAQLDNQEIDVNGYVKQVDRMANQIRRVLPKKATDEQRLAAMNKYLFKENGFHGSRTEYYHPANRYMNRVIDDREGIPIMLSVLYIELGRKIGLKLEGVGLPGHFVVRFVPQKKDKKSKPRLIDVFDQGKILEKSAAAKKVRETSGQELKDEHLAASSQKAILTRMLVNLLSITQTQREKDKESTLRYLEALLAIDPMLLRERGFRALVRYQTGRHQAAIEDLDWFLEKEPKGVDLNRIRQMRADFLQKRPIR